jgi:hypothetical protein
MWFSRNPFEPSVCGIKMAAALLYTKDKQHLMPNLAAISTIVAAFKHFNPLAYTALWQTVLSIHGSQLPMDLCLFHSYIHQNTYCYILLLSLVQTTSEEVIFTPCSISTNGI